MVDDKAVRLKPTNYFGRCATIAELSHGIFHELNNHLQVALGFLQNIATDAKDFQDEGQEIATTIQETQKCCELIGYLRFLEMATEGESYEDVEIILNHLFPLLNYKTRKKNLQWRRQITHPLDFICGEMGKIRSIVMALLLVALERSKEKSELVIHAYNDGESLIMEVTLMPKAGMDRNCAHPLEDYLKTGDYPFSVQFQEPWQTYRICFPRAHTVD